MSRKIELVFAAFFALFFIGWLTFDIPVALGFVYKGTGWYAREIDPIFRDPPSWLNIVGWYALAYGPFYAATVYGFIRRSSWLPYVVLPLAGKEVATVGIYFVEELTGDVQPLNWTMFYVLNGPYIVVPVLAALWVNRAREEDGHRASPPRAASAEARRREWQKALDQKKAALAQRMHASGESASTIATALGVSRATVYRVLAASAH